MSKGIENRKKMDLESIIWSHVNRPNHYSKNGLIWVMAYKRN